MDVFLCCVNFFHFMYALFQEGQEKSFSHVLQRGYPEYSSYGNGVPDFVYVMVMWSFGTHYAPVQLLGVKSMDIKVLLPVSSPKCF